MADVVVLGTQAKSRGWIDEFLPVAALGGLALLAVYLLPGILSQVTNRGTSSGSTGTAGTPSALDSISKTVSQLITGIPQSIQAAVNVPGQYVNLGTSSTPQQGYGIGSLFVNTGAGFPTNLFPLGDVIDTSQTLTGGQQAETIANLCKEPYTGWWTGIGICPGG